MGNTYLKNIPFKTLLAISIFISIGCEEERLRKYQSQIKSNFIQKTKKLTDQSKKDPEYKNNYAATESMKRLFLEDDGAFRVPTSDEVVKEIQPGNEITNTDSSCIEQSKKIEANCSEDGKCVYQKYMPVSAQSISKDCNRDKLKNLISSRVQHQIPAGGNKNNTSIAVIEIDEQGQQVGLPILEKNSEQLEAVASSQKILTSYILYKNLSKISFPAKMGSNAKKVVFKKSGKHMGTGFAYEWWRNHSNSNLSAATLIKGIMQHSSNGASFRAMELVTGSADEKVHAKLINDTAKEILGPDAKTNFSNSHGLDRYSYGYSSGGTQKEGVHGSTPLEMARLMGHINSDPGYKEFLKLEVGGSYPVKGGMTKRAGKNHVMSLKKNDGNCAGRNFAIFYGGGSYTFFDPIN